MKPQMLWIKCPVCGGTKKTRTDFRKSSGGTMPAGSTCFACCEGPEGDGEPLGFVEFGMTEGAFGRLLDDRDRLLAFVADVADYPADPATHPDLAGLVGRATEMTGERAGEVVEARRRIAEHPAT